jgi:bifunctional non-homologous end joining protein LigD
MAALTNTRKPGRKSAAPAPPAFVKPQLATLVAEPPTGEGWVHEIKFDGYRLLARIAQRDVALITRANNDWTDKFKALAGELARLGVGNALIDGEVVHVAQNASKAGSQGGTKDGPAYGTMSFHGLQNALSTGNGQDLHYYAFDLLFLDGVDLRAQPLLERKAALAKILKKAPAHIHFSEHMRESGAKVLAHACGLALEGIVSKRAAAPYRSGRSDLWLKSKCLKEQELVIGGFTEQPKHPGMLGALLMGYHEDGALVFAGKVGTGFSHREGRALLQKLKRLAQPASPFRSLPVASRRGARFVKPTLVAQINFTEWTDDGVMRHPSFQGLRDDKPAREVVRERPS